MAYIVKVVKSVSLCYFWVSCLLIDGGEAVSWGVEPPRFFELLGRNKIRYSVLAVRFCALKSATRGFPGYI